MIYREIPTTEFPCFYHLVPARILSEIDDTGVFGLAAYDETAENYPAAAMVFSVSEAQIEILWFYVADGYRGKHVADGLLGRFFAKTAMVPYQSIRMRVPDIPGAEQTIRFFREYTFSFEPAYSFELLAPFDAFTKHKSLRNTKKPESGIAQLRSVQKGRALTFLSEQKKIGNAQKLYERADQRVSVVHAEDDRLLGICLFEKPEGDVMRLAVLSDSSGEPEYYRKEMLRVACHMIRHVYDDAPDIYFPCGSGLNGELMDHLCPDMHPARIWRGVYHMPVAFVSGWEQGLEEKEDRLE